MAAKRHQTTHAQCDCSHSSTIVFWCEFSFAFQIFFTKEKTVWQKDKKGCETKQNKLRIEK